MQRQVTLSSSSLNGARVAGTLTLIASGMGAVAAAGVTGYMRLEALAPGQQHLCAEGLRLWPASAACTADGTVWTALVAAHGILMLFFVALPALLGGFGMLALPRLIGVRDMAFPRLAIGGGVLQMVATALATGALFAPGAPAGGGLAATMGIGALYLTGLALLTGAVNTITTFFSPREGGVTWSGVPVFAWTLLAANGVVLLSVPVLAAAVATLSGGVHGSLLWVFGHPAILAIVLPALGLVAQGVGMQTGGPLVGRNTVITTVIGAAGLGFFVWAERLLSGNFISTPGIIIGALCIAGPVVATLLASFLSLRRMTGPVQTVGWWIVALLGIVAVGMVATLGLWLSGLPTIGVVHQTIGLGVVFALMSAVYLMLAQQQVGGAMGMLHLIGMTVGASFVLLGQVLPMGGWLTSVGTLVCVVASLFLVPLIIRAVNR